jgi:hypothetical protein
MLYKTLSEGLFGATVNNSSQNKKAVSFDAHGSFVSGCKITN